MKLAVVTVLAVLAPVRAMAAEAPRFALPLDCKIGKTCYIQKYADRDRGPRYADYRCGPLSADGHKGTDIRLLDFAAMTKGVAVLAADARRREARQVAHDVVLQALGVDDRDPPVLRVRDHVAHVEVVGHDLRGAGVEGCLEWAEVIGEVVARVHLLATVFHVPVQPVELGSSSGEVLRHRDDACGTKSLSQSMVCALRVCQTRVQMRAHANCSSPR